MNNWKKWIITVFLVLSAAVLMCGCRKDDKGSNESLSSISDSGEVLPDYSDPTGDNTDYAVDDSGDVTMYEDEYLYDDADYGIISDE